MSYQVTAFKVKAIKQLKVPLLAIANLGEIIITTTNGKIDIQGPLEQMAIVGDFIDGIVAIDSIYYGGEGSGSMWDDFKGALSESSGELEVIVIWEGGDSLSKLTVINGQVTDEDFEV